MKKVDIKVGSVYAVTERASRSVNPFDHSWAMTNTSDVLRGKVVEISHKYIDTGHSYGAKRNVERTGILVEVTHGVKMTCSRKEGVYGTVSKYAPVKLSEPKKVVLTSGACVHELWSEFVSTLRTYNDSQEQSGLLREEKQKTMKAAAAQMEKYGMRVSSTHSSISFASLHEVKWLTQAIRYAHDRGFCTQIGEPGNG